MYDAISLVLVAAVVAAGAAGLFGSRRRARATGGRRPARPTGRPRATPPPYRIVAPGATGTGRPGPEPTPDGVGPGAPDADGAPLAPDRPSAGPPRP